MSYVHLKTRSTFSLKKATIKPSELVKTAKKDGCDAVALTEIGNLFSSVRFYKECKDAKIKPILGCELQIQEEDGGLSSLTLLCKNLTGWKELLQIVARSNLNDNFNFSKEIATIKLDELAHYVHGNFVVYSGSLGSYITRDIATNQTEFIRASAYGDAKNLVKEGWQSNFDLRVAKLQDIFGKANVFLEYNTVDNDSIHAANIVSKIVKDANIRLNIPTVATCKPHYLKPEDADDLKVLICVDKKATFRNIGEILKNSQDTEYYPFFQNKNAYLYNKEDYERIYSQEMLENNKLVASMCEEYNILNSPKIPNFQCPNGLTPEQYVKKLCESKWKELVPRNQESVYKARFAYEYKVLSDVALHPYFLIIHDLVQYVTKNSGLSAGRGSAGGSLVAYLLGLVECDPIQYNLIFERFYNAGRNQPGHVSLPDIDLDCPALFRDDITEYTRTKYGRDKTASIATFGSLKGAGALKEVLRVNNACDTTTMNQMTRLIIDEHKIADELEELKKAGEDASIIGWSLDNVPALKQYAFYNDDEELCGDYGKYFEQAIGLEGCKRTLSKHACGLVVSSEPLVNFCPMVRDKNSDELMIGLEMNEAEAVGCLKFDLLGVSAIDDIMETIKIVNHGDLIRA